jgi:hypothetical protein
VGNGELSEEMKVVMAAEMKKVQFSLDRALRGDR